MLLSRIYCPSDNVEVFEPEEDREKAADHTPSEGEEKKSDDNIAAINQDDDEQPEDNDDDNSKKLLFYILRPSFQGEQGQSFLKDSKR